MKILFTGGGSGGHFYPIIAIAEELNQIAKERRLVKPDLYYMSTEPYNEGLLFENGITFKKISAGKIRREMSSSNIISNLIDSIKTFFGVIIAIWKVFLIYPDVVFGKGGYASFPAILAARLLFIPVVIHESDSIPGKVNIWAGKFAERIAISYPEAINFFPKDKTAYTGNPIRKEMQEPFTDDPYKFLNLDPNIPIILILGGSQGARTINEKIMDSLPELVERYQMIHQTGKKNIQAVQGIKDIILQNNQNKDKYKPFEYLNTSNMQAALLVASLVISRAGSTIFEIALWGKPSIIIPIPEPTSHDQRSNAYAYARSGAAEVIEEENLSSRLLILEIDRILSNQKEIEKMSSSAKAFARKDSAKLIAEEITAIALSHEI